ncbi:MAG: TonB-dependent receptor [Acidobacteria bacterium]|nr:TonB-dependent receptor [Acidobacteriota bacterium]
MRQAPQAIAPAICLLLAAGAAAQDYRARLQGVVTDPSHAAVAGARVMLRSTQTAVEAVKTTDTNGYYIFDYVEPGTYTVVAELTGFRRFERENISVLTRGDVTVNVALQLGEMAQSVTVSEQAVTLQFNTTTLSQTIDRKMLAELPVLARNPFTLALLDPAVVNRYSSVEKRNPFYQLSSNGVDVGGQTSGRNDLLLDGVPIGVGSRGSYAPPMDAVQEFTVQQNSVDAEFGHSAGGILSVSMKSGTNDVHGTAYYFGRNPALNAVSNSVTRSPNLVRNHIWGGTVGNAIVKNKLFNFFAYEQWRNHEPRTKILTLPTDLQRTGDFSQSLNRGGQLRVIYDPWTTQFTPATGAVARTPFAGNRIPASRIDPSSQRFLQDIWKPNHPGDDQTGVNNYKITYTWFLDYWNLSNRSDWYINDKWKMYARYSVIRTRLDNSNYAGSPAVPSDNGGLMDSLNAAADTVYTMNASTVLNLRFGVVYSEDDYDSEWAKVGEAGLERYWSGNAWYKPYLKELPAVYYPNISIAGSGFGKNTFWLYRPRKYNFQGTLAKDRGRHYMKVGVSYRHAYESSQLPGLGTFTFSPALTADTFISPNTGLRGDGWATFLLGAIDSGSYATYTSALSPRMKQYGLFFQDDFKISRRVTLNLGLRWEYEAAPVDASDRLSRYLDLKDPIPEMTANPPRIPADVSALNNVPYVYNGAWVFADSEHRGLYDAPKDVFLPRAGVALRVNDKTALRIGYARYLMPLASVFGYAWRIPATGGFNARTNVAPLLEGVPQARLNDPFPATNPLILPVGKGYGRYTNLGDNARWPNQDLKPPINNRFNFTVERELPDHVRFDFTYFVNLGQNLPPEGQGGNDGFGRRLNMSDPQLSYTHKAALSRRIPNPFFGYLTQDKFPGQLRYQPTVTVGSLLKPYPQYGDLAESFMEGVSNRYQALQFRVQRRSERGYTFLWGYNYNRELTGAFFNADDEYANRLTLMPNASPRHRMSLAATYDLPFGRGRKFIPGLHPVAEAVFGGWSLSTIYLWNSGQFLRFGQMDTDGSNPRIDNPTRQRWFDTSKFKQATPFTPRTNPWQYPGVTGPGYWNWDATISKHFPVTERVRLEFRFEAYNLANAFMPGNPNMNVNSSLFGRSTNQANQGRELQYTMRLHF